MDSHSPIVETGLILIVVLHILNELLVIDLAVHCIITSNLSEKTVKGLQTTSNWQYSCELTVIVQLFQQD